MGNAERFGWLPRKRPMSGSIPRPARGSTGYRLPAVAALALLSCTIASEPALGGEEAASASVASDGAASFEGLMRLFASSGGVRSRFRETRQLALLEAPLEAEGWLYFDPPDRLSRHTLRPEPSIMVTHAGRVALRDADGSRVLEFGSRGIAAQFVDNLGAVLRGDVAALRERFSVRFGSLDGDWSLELVPRSTSVRRVLAWIRFRGEGGRLRSMEVRETSGDTVLTVFGAVETGLAFSPDDIERFFSIDGISGAP